MRSDAIKKGIERAPQRAALYAVGCGKADLEKPFIGIISSSSEIFPGHLQLDTIAQWVKAGVRSAGGVIVIRYEGPKGSPGMVEMLWPTSLLCGMGADKDVALITDGRFSGASRGAAVGHISPEAASGGPIAVVRDGDIIKIDIRDHKILVELTDTELGERLKHLPPFVSKVKSGYLKRYLDRVTSASNGAVLQE